MRAALALILSCLALAMWASGFEHGCRAWAVLVFLSVTAFMLALIRVHAVANAPRRNR